jgi:hypothetical protein
MVLMSPTPLVLSLVLSGMLFVPAKESIISIISMNTWQAMVDTVDAEEEMDQDNGNAPVEQGNGERGHQHGAGFGRGAYQQGHGGGCGRGAEAQQG